MLRRFPSMKQPAKYAYAYDTDQWTMHAEVHSHFRQYETYGDGICQHSGDWAITKEFMPDFLASLATAMLTDDELTQNLAFTFNRAPSAEKIAFAASVVWKDADKDAYGDKRRFFSVSLMKIAKGKEHDRRFEEISKWCDGSPEAIYRMLASEYHGALEMYATAKAIRTWGFETQKNFYMQHPAQFLKWTNNSDTARDFRYSFAACKAITQAYQLRSEAMTHLNNIRPAKEVYCGTEQEVSANA